MEKNLKNYALVALKGVGMGAADVVPGVSGGTIAFVTGIYDTLITSIKSINVTSLKPLLSGCFKAFRQAINGNFSLSLVIGSRCLKAFWQAINGNFLLSLVIGIGASIFSLAKLISYLLVKHPIPLWAFFFGLVLASTWTVSKDIQRWKIQTVGCFLLGTLIAFYITMAPRAQTPDTLWFLFLSGAIAICAMILPGISGSFILVLLGQYDTMIDAVKDLDIVKLITFAAGAAIGITSFSHLLSYLLKNYHDIAIAVLAGFMLGSLNKVWPWKDIDGTTNTLPGEHLWLAISLAVIGFVIVLAVERLGRRTAQSA
jgi:putative membrane protein